MATALNIPTGNPKVLAQVGLQKLLVCFSSSDDWRVLVSMAGKLAIPGNAAVHVCYKDLDNQPRSDGTTFSSSWHRRPFDFPASSLRAMQALRDLGLNVEFTNLPVLRRETRHKISSDREANLIVMSTAFSRSIALCSHAFTSQAVRLVRKPILFLQADRQPSAIMQNRTGPVVAAVSLSERSIPVVQHAAQYAETLGSSLTVVHVIDSLHNFSRPDNLMSLMCACETLGKAVAQPGLRVYPRLTYGTVADVLTKADFIGSAPFVALGVDLSEGQSDAMESDAMRDTIVQNAPCPVLLIPTNWPLSVA